MKDTAQTPQYLYIPEIKYYKSQKNFNANIIDFKVNSTKNFKQKE